MRGSHHIIVEAPRLKYEFTIRRNITVIQGDSATGKTTLVDLIRDYGQNHSASPVRITSDVPCEVVQAPEGRWKELLRTISDTIVFLDEDQHFIRTKEFADVILGSSNYYVLITRESLPNLPYSIQEIYGIRTSGKYHFPEKIYHEFYPIYGAYQEDVSDPEGLPYLISEDARSGYIFLKGASGGSDNCISAGGNANIYSVLRSLPADASAAVIADGAAFGAFISKTLALAGVRKNVMLYFPESFEWIILKSGVVAVPDSSGILEHPEEYIDSEDYFSWEQFFTALLENSTREDGIREYHKNNLRPFYLTESVRGRMIAVMPEELQRVIDLLRNSSTVTASQKEIVHEQNTDY